MALAQKRYHYSKSKIVEALIEAKFQYDSFDPALAGQFYEKVRAEYPLKKNLNLITVVLGSSDNNPSSSLPPQAPLLQAWNKSESELLQVGPGIVTANRIKYTTFEEFLPSFKLALESYFEIANPKFYSRVGVRYINRYLFDENVNISDFFKLGLSIPSTFKRLEALDLTLVSKVDVSAGKPSLLVKAKFASDTLKPGEVGTAIVLDLDCYTPEPGQAELSRIIELATLAHEQLEDVFESFLQDKLRGLMEGKERK